MDTVNVLKEIITYGLPVVSFVYQIWKDYSDTKIVENIVFNYNNSNFSNIDIDGVNIQNGNFTINTNQNISREVSDELEKFNEKRLENLKFLSDSLHRVSFILIFCLFLINIFMNLNLNDISSDNFLKIIKNLKFDMLVAGIDKTIQSSFAMLAVYSILIFIKYIVQKNRFANQLLFMVISISYIFSLFYLHSNVLNKLEPLNIGYAIVFRVTVVLTVFYALNIVVYRIFGLELKYKSSIKSGIVNQFQSICTILPSILIILLGFWKII
ncbi:hypothetical protein [Streptococcus pluranimalium]|uniref:hypothetical protein n=1 Tax=Streptococcus pluranimalium TaxID=82348 RepID=UPI003F6756FF